MNEPIMITPAHKAFILNAAGELLVVVERDPNTGQPLLMFVDNHGHVAACVGFSTGGNNPTLIWCDEKAKPTAGATLQTNGELFAAKFDQDGNVHHVTDAPAAPWPSIDDLRIHPN